MRIFNTVFFLIVAHAVLGQYTGGAADGFSTIVFTPTLNKYYSGGDGDGFSLLAYTPVANKYYTGGAADGFALQHVFQDYVWTGTIGTGWNVAGNWSTNQIPTLRHDVIIPAGAANWPALNAGVLSIGRNPNNAQFVCNSILVDTNAEMTTRINCFVTNYGQFFVKGSLFVKNTAADAFVNKINGQFGVRDGIAIMGAN